MGSPATPEGKKQLERQSPLNSADKIKTPLLVVQGANDPRVKRAESDQIVIALRDRGFPVEYLVAPDEGHGFARPVNNMAMFATRGEVPRQAPAGTLPGGGDAGGRDAAEGDHGRSEDRDAAEEGRCRVGRLRRSPRSPCAPARRNTRRRIGAGGQTIAMTITEVIKEEDGAWVATETATTPMGDMIDSTTLDKGTLVPTKRSIRQGPLAVELAFADGKATGTMGMSGQPKPVSVELGGPLFADGGGSHAVIATLPLAEGYTTTFRNFDVQKQKVSLKQVKVVGRGAGHGAGRARSPRGRCSSRRRRASRARRPCGSRRTAGRWSRSPRRCRRWAMRRSPRS